MKNHLFFLLLFSFGLLSSTGCNDKETKNELIKDGGYILLSDNKRENYALIKIVEQKANPEKVRYLFSISNNGAEGFKFENDLVKMEASEGTENINSGVFRLGWSVEGVGGAGWLYFGHFPGGKALPNGLMYNIYDSPDIIPNKKWLKSVIK